MIGPTPKMSVSDVPDAVTASVMRCLGALQLGVEDADLVEELVRELETLTLRQRSSGSIAGEELFGLVDNDFLADPARDQLAHQARAAGYTRGSGPGRCRAALWPTGATPST